MLGCGRCGRVETTPGHAEANSGQIVKLCPECSGHMRWIGIAEAVTLTRGRREPQLLRSEGTGVRPLA
jgi:hypothetical protein